MLRGFLKQFLNLDLFKDHLQPDFSWIRKGVVTASFKTSKDQLYVGEVGRRGRLQEVSL